MTREKRLRDMIPLKAEEVKGQVVTHASSTLGRLTIPIPITRARYFFS